MSKAISEAKFKLYTVGTRPSPHVLFFNEICWFSDLDENVSGTVIFDKDDQD